MGKRARKGSNETAAGQAASTVRGVNCKSLVLAFPGFGFRLCKCIMGRKQAKGRPCLSPPICQSVLQVMREDKKLEPQTEAETEEKASNHSLSACSRWRASREEPFASLTLSCGREGSSGQQGFILWVGVCPRKPTPMPSRE